MGKTAKLLSKLELSEVLNVCRRFPKYQLELVAKLVHHINALEERLRSSITQAALGFEKEFYSPSEPPQTPTHRKYYTAPLTREVGMNKQEIFYELFKQGKADLTCPEWERATRYFSTPHEEALESVKKKIRDEAPK